jgi:predicted metal-binding membrane protein
MTPLLPDRAAPPPSWRQFLPLAAGVAVVVVVCWAYLIAMAWGMANMQAAVDWSLMPRMTHWTRVDLLLVFAMWTLMMAGMMLPSALPLLWVHARLHAAQTGRRAALASAAALALGYLTVWTGFSVAATLAQWGLLEARLVSPMMASSSRVLSGVLLIVAGAYQFTPLKNVCLARCRTPLGSLLNSDAGIAAGFRTGLLQGAYCTVCCAPLMALLFVLGVMNLLWIAALTLFVLIEKSLARPRWFVRVSGVLLLVWGIVVLSGLFV